jgi:CubicO group peptidase (beta-lactamase class C family)
MPGDLSPAQMLAAMRYLEPSDDIRSTFQYHNLGYFVASIVAECISDRSWPEFTSSRLTDKLHMNVTFTVEESRRSGRCRRALRDGRGYPPARETLAAHIWNASSPVLPTMASGPVSSMLNPMVIGSAARALPTRAGTEPAAIAMLPITEVTAVFTITLWMRLVGATVVGPLG